MTTYTLTQAQLDGAISGKANALLKALKPNSQEPSHYLDGSGVVYSASRAKCRE